MNRKQRRVMQSQEKQAAAPSPSHVTDIMAQGITLHRAGKLNEAEAIYRNVLETEPDNADVLGMLGTIMLQRNNLQESLWFLEKAISVNPLYVQAIINCAVALNRLKRHEEAIAYCDQAIVISPDSAATYNCRGQALHALKRYGDALSYYARAITINPQNANAYNDQGITFYELEQYDSAVASHSKAIAIHPHNAEAYNNLGMAQEKLKQHEAAIASYDRAISINPHYVKSYYNKGLLLFKSGQSQGALEYYNKAIAMHSAYSKAYNSRALLFAEQQQYSAALENLDKAIALDSTDPDAYWNKSTYQLMLGNYKEGWELFEWRWKTKQLTAEAGKYNNTALWLGKEPLTGKTILLHAEQGQGDTLQFCRYVPMVEALGTKVILEVPHTMAGLMSTLKGHHAIVNRGAHNIPHDFHCSLMSLPLVFETTVETIPAEPYLGTQQEYVEKWEPILNDKLGSRGQARRIGLCWAGGIRPENPDANRMDAKRSLHFSQLKPLLDCKNAVFVSLQLDQPKVQRDDERVADISAELKSWADTAAVISLLDLVITVDTAVCHLAGAMGKKTFMLNRYDSCWRWLMDRDDSPWYPSLTQFRQQKPGDWESVVERVKAELAVLTES